MKSRNINMGDIIKFKMIDEVFNKLVDKYGIVIRRLNILESIEVKENNSMSYQVRVCDIYENRNYYVPESEILEVYKKEEDFNL